MLPNNSKFKHLIMTVIVRQIGIVIFFILTASIQALLGQSEVKNTANSAATDVTIENGTLSSFSGYEATYTFLATQSADGTVTVDIGVSAAQDAPGLESTAEEQFSITYNEAAINVNPTSGLTTTEAGGSDTFTVVLSAQPTGDVSISLTSSDTTEGTVLPSSVVFTISDWDTAQTVTITGVDDDVMDGDQAYTIVLGQAVSDDPNYSGLDPEDVSVTNVDMNAPSISVNLSKLSFGPVRRDSSGMKTFRVFNTGTSVLAVSQVRVTGGMFTVSDTSFEVLPSDSNSVVVTFTPVDVISYIEKLMIVHDDTSRGDVTISLTGKGVKPVISVSVTELDFGQVLTGRDAVITVRVSNEGSDTLNIDSVYTTDPTYTFAFVTRILPGEAADLMVTFTPEDTGDFPATLTILSDDPDRRQTDIALSGGCLTYPVALYNSTSFGVTTLQGDEVPFDLVITNSGGYPLDYAIEEDAVWLTVSQDAGQVAGEGSETIPVTVTETLNLEEGTYESRLLITTNSGVDLTQVTDTVGVSLRVLPDTGAITSGVMTIPAGDSPPVEMTDEAGNSLGVTFDFSAGSGGDLSVTFIPSYPPTVSTTGFYDPDSLVIDPVYADFYWEILSTMPEGFVTDITFDYASQIGVRNPAELRLARRMNYGGPGVVWEFIATDSVVVDEANGTITALSQMEFSQWTVASERADNTFEDTEAPVISDIAASPTSPDALESVTVTATVTDESSVESVSLYYLKGGEAGFQEVSMTGETGVYTGIIPAADVTLTGIAYTIYAVDMVGYGQYSDTLSVEVQFEAGALSTDINGSAFPNGMPKNKWRLISVPTELDEPGISEIFTPALEGKPSKTTWRIFEWTGSDWIDAEEVSAGQGYWLYQMVNNDVVFSTGSGRSVDLTGTELSIQQGWNLISSPYPFAVKVAVDQSQFYGPLTYGRSEGDGWSDVVTELEPWGGYIIYNRENSARTIDIQPLEETGVLAGLADQAGWQLQLMAKGETYSDVANTIGRLAGAQEELDYFDNPEPPYIGGYVSLAMDRPEWSRNGGIPRFTSDIRSLEETDGTWDIDLYVKGETGPIELVPALSEEVPADIQIVLLDPVTREVYDLIERDDDIIITDYTAVWGSGGIAYSYPFKVIAGSPDYVSHTVNEVLSLLPEKITLSQNYPNPFNPSTRIRYALPRPQLVTLKVYNIIGQEVVTLVDGWRDLGYHVVIWDGKNRFGHNVSSGLYLSTLFTGERVISRKMVLMR